MTRFVVGDDRSQSTLFPERLEDYLSEDNPVRAIDVFVDELDLAGLGFGGIEPEATGRPAYHPATLLKIYVYGYLNRVQSSRRLERECQRNIELVWLTGRLMPDFKTIADFRKGRFSDAGCPSVGMVSACRHPKTCTLPEVKDRLTRGKRTHERRAPIRQALTWARVQGNPSAGFPTKHFRRSDEAIFPSGRSRAQTNKRSNGTDQQRGSVMWDIIISLFYRQSCKTALSAIRIQNQLLA
jgi:transposase